jgi:hypothetical protein
MVLSFMNLELWIEFLVAVFALLICHCFCIVFLGCVERMGWLVERKRSLVHICTSQLKEEWRYRLYDVNLKRNSSVTTLRNTLNSFENLKENQELNIWVSFHSNKLWCKSSSVSPTPGGGVLACSNPSYTNQNLYESLKKRRKLMYLTSRELGL